MQCFYTQEPALSHDQNWEVYNEWNSKQIFFTGARKQALAFHFFLHYIEVVASPYLFERTAEFGTHKVEVSGVPSGVLTSTL